MHKVSQFKKKKSLTAKFFVNLHVKNTESWVQFSGSCSRSLHLPKEPSLSRLGWLEWEEGQWVFSGREKRKERQSGDLSKHMGVCLNPSHTDVLAAEAARKQASALFLPHLLLFFFLFVYLFFTLPLCAFPLFLFVLYSSLRVGCSASPSHLDDYSKIKRLKKLWTEPATNESARLGPIWGHHHWVQLALTHPQHKLSS